MGKATDWIWTIAVAAVWVPLGVNFYRDHISPRQIAYAWKPRQNGPYYATTKINGVEAMAVVDTGATEVVLDRAIARKAKARLLRLEGVYGVADGREITCRMAVVAVQVGDIHVPRVTAAVCPYKRDTILLGQSFISRVRMSTDHTAYAKFEYMGE